VCTPVTSVNHGGGQPPAVTRAVECQANGSSNTDTACGPNVPQCKLLTDGGQDPGVQISAYAIQQQDPATGAWTTTSFWCPHAAVPAAAPNAASLRDQVLRLLPTIAVGTTARTATLVNVQTLLWADTSARRDLGTVVLLNQPVRLRVDLHHASWDFGDGHADTTTGPGKAYDADADPCSSVTCSRYYGHTYTITGPMTITLTVTWTATYSLDGATWQIVDAGPITGPADTRTITARQARGVLVADPDH
jgi:hypothetical protein